MAVLCTSDFDYGRTQRTGKVLCLPSELDSKHPVVSINFERDGKDLAELAFIFNNIGKMNEIPPILRNKGFEKMFEMSKFAAMDEKEIIEYYARQKDIIDQRGALSSARRDGLEEGRAEGRVEQALSIAKALKTDNVPLDTIQRYTGLSLADIQAL